MFRHLLMMLSVGMLLVAATHAEAGGPAADPVQKSPVAAEVQKSGGGGVQCVEKIVCVPEWVTEMRKVCVTQYRQEQRTVTNTVYRCVPEQHQVQRSCTIMVPETRTKTIQVAVCKPVISQVTQEYTVPVPVYRNVERTYTAMVPTIETRQSVRRVCKMVPEQVTYTVCVDRGSWTTQTIEVPCAPRRCRTRCGSCTVCCATTRVVCRRVWCPNIVQEQCVRTVCRPQWSEVPCQYNVTVCKPVTRTCTVRVCEMSYEKRTCTRNVCTYETSTVDRQVCYTVCVPQKREWTETVTTYKQVPEEVTNTYTVCVPEQVEKEVPVRVCRMVQKTIQVPVCPPVCGGCRRCRRCGC